MIVGSIADGSGVVNGVFISFFLKNLRLVQYTFPESFMLSYSM